MKKKIFKSLAVVACALLLVVGSVVGTFAYMTSKTGVVTNTFTAGNVAITLDEAKVTVYGELDGDSRVNANTYKLIPGHTYKKDPTIKVATGSEDCYLFVKIENGLGASETSIATQLAANHWTALDGHDGVYYYSGDTSAVVSAEATVKVFESFTLAGTADVATLASKSITVQAYAVQADGFANAPAAYAAAPCTWGANN